MSAPPPPFFTHAHTHMPTRVGVAITDRISDNRQATDKQPPNRYQLARYRLARYQLARACMEPHLEDGSEGSDRWVVERRVGPCEAV